MITELRGRAYPNVTWHYIHGRRQNLQPGRGGGGGGGVITAQSVQEKFPLYFTQLYNTLSCGLIITCLHRNIWEKYFKDKNHYTAEPLYTCIMDTLVQDTLSIIQRCPLLGVWVWLIAKVDDVIRPMTS